ncbi:hypothetical protein D3C86_1807590 [compost metagenome]
MLSCHGRRVLRYRLSPWFALLRPLLELRQPRRLVVQLPQIEPQGVVVDASEHRDRQAAQRGFQTVQASSAQTFGRVGPNA